MVVYIVMKVYTVTSKHPNVETRDRAEVDRKIIQVQENKPERKQTRGTSVTGMTEEKQGQ